MLLLLLLGFLVTMWVKWSFRKGFYFKRKKSSSFECGFDMVNLARLPFSLRFFYMVVLFLLLDMELVLLFQIPLILDSTLWSCFFIMLSFFSLMTFGLLEEARRGYFNWF